MRFPLTEEDVEAALDHITELATHVRKKHRELRIRHTQVKLNAPDGYPRQSLGGGGHSGISDPTLGTGAHRAEHPAPDLVGEAIHKLIATVSTTRRSLEGAVGDAANALEKTQRPKARKVDESIWCSWHLTHGYSEPLGKHARNGLCNWCDTFLRTYGEKPPPELLAKKDRKERVFSSDIQHALRSQPKPTSKRKKKR